MTIELLVQIFLMWKAVLYLVGCSAASLISTAFDSPVAPLPLVVTIENVSGHCQLSPVEVRQPWSEVLVSKE